MKATYVEVNQRLRILTKHPSTNHFHPVQIYNEQLRDLLLPDTTQAGDRPQVSIREDTKGRIILTGLHEISVNSVDDLLSALNFGSSIRQTDSTAINAKSSRSHAVFTVYLVRRKQKVFDKRYSAPIETYPQTESMVTVESKFHFVDLAGSERLKVSLLFISNTHIATILTPLQRILEHRGIVLRKAFLLMLD